MTPRPTPAVPKRVIGFLDLPGRQQDEIANHVRASAQLMSDQLSSIHLLSDRDLEDVCRWAIDGYARSSLVESAYEQGYEDAVNTLIDELPLSEEERRGA